MKGSFETGWEGLWLVVEDHDGYHQACVFDPIKCEVLYTATRMRCENAKLAAVEFAINNRFGLQHDLKPQDILDTLVWERMV